MSGAPRGRGGFGGGRGGAPRGGGFGGRGGGRGGFGGRPSGDFGPPETVVEVGTFLHPCESEMVCKSSTDKIPYFNAPIYLENKQKIGKVEEVLGPVNEVFFTVKMDPGMNSNNFQPDAKFYIAPDKLLPASRFQPPPPGSKPAGGAGRGGFGGRGGGRGGGFGGRGGGRGGGFGGRGGGGRGGGFGGRGGAGGRGGGFGGRGGGRGGGFGGRGGGRGGY